MTINVRAASERFVTRAEGRTTRHSFSFGNHDDPDNIGFGLVVAHNDELLPARTGYPRPPARRPRDRHRHAVGRTAAHLLRRHRRRRPRRRRPRRGAAALGRHRRGPCRDVRLGGATHFVQTWVRPSEPGGSPSYVRAADGSGAGLVPLVGGDAAVDVGADGRLFSCTLPAGISIGLPDSCRLHVFVTEGVLWIGEARLGPADAARISDEGGRTVSAQDDCEPLVWATRSVSW